MAGAVEVPLSQALPGSRGEYSTQQMTSGKRSSVLIKAAFEEGS